MPGQARQLLRIQRQRALQHQHGKQQHKAEHVEQQDGQQIVPPVHHRAVNAGQTPQHAFAARQQGFIRHHQRQQAAQRLRQHQQHQQKAGNQQKRLSSHQNASALIRA